MTWAAVLVRKFLYDEKGAIAAIFGVSVMVLSLIIAVAIDTSRFYSLSSKLQSALDAAALAAAKLLDEEGASDSDVKARAKAFFDSRTEKLRVEGATVANFDAVPNRTTGAVKVTVDTSISTIFGQLGNIAPSISFKPEATVIFRAKKIELALVLDVTGSMCMGCDKMDSLKVAAKDIVDNLFASNPAPGSVKVSLVPYSASVNAGAYFSMVSGVGIHTDTCVIERDGGAPYTDAPPGGPNNFGITDSATHPSYSCPTAPIVPLTDLSDSIARNNFKVAIDAMAPVGATAGHIGTAWGWYTLSPAWSAIWPSPSRPRPSSPDVIKAVILMTDGMFNTAYRNGGEILSAGDRVDPTKPGSAAYQALQLCQAMKDDDVRIYTVAFQAPIEAKDLLEQCGGADNFYDANDRAKLIASFQDIISKLTQLRVSN